MKSFILSIYQGGIVLNYSYLDHSLFIEKTIQCSISKALLTQMQNVPIIFSLGLNNSNLNFK